MREGEELRMTPKLPTWEDAVNITWDGEEGGGVVLGERSEAQFCV